MPEYNEFHQLIGDIVKDASPRSYPTKNKLIGKYGSIEILNIEAHAAKLFSIFNSPESWTYLPYGPFDAIGAFSAWIKKTIAHGDILYAIVDKKNQPLGACGYLRIFPEHASIEIGHLHFSTLLKQTPLATEAIYLMMQYAFDELQYRRVEWKCHALNAASKKAALRFGFQYEGTFRQSNIFKNRNRDTAWFSIIDSEWPALKNKFEKWLDGKNFDGDGSQIKKLQQF